MASFTGGSVCKDKNGIIYFGSTNGLCYFIPSYILEKKQSPQAVIGKLTIFEPITSENSNETAWKTPGTLSKIPIMLLSATCLLGNINFSSKRAYVIKNGQIM